MNRRVFVRVTRDSSLHIHNLSTKQKESALRHVQRHPTGLHRRHHGVGQLGGPHGHQGWGTHTRVHTVVNFTCTPICPHLPSCDHPCPQMWLPCVHSGMVGVTCVHSTSARSGFPPPRDIRALALRSRGWLAGRYVGGAWVDGSGDACTHVRIRLPAHNLFSS